jgi:FkbH-like protein
MDTIIHGTVVSTFNAKLLANYLENDISVPPFVSVTTAPFGQVHSYLLTARPDRTDGFLIVWTQPEAVVGSFQKLLNGEPAQLDAILAEVDEFARLVRSVGERYAQIMLPSWVIPTYHRGLGAVDLKNGTGVRNCLWRMNLRLCDRFQHDANIFVLNAEQWIERSGAESFDPKLWYMGKMPFAPSVFMEAALDCKATLRAAYGLGKKLIIVDLDETLWGGIVGDDGWENLRLGGHDPIGEAYRDFQRNLKMFMQRGILLGIVSKNEEATALNAINAHPEMVLRQEDFAGWKINWADKAENVRQLAADLRLGLQSVVFIDDNPVERARVAEALPEVEVPDWPADPMLASQTLLNLSVFDSVALTSEDTHRTALYQSERRREDLKLQSATMEEWLASLHMKIGVAELNSGNMTRAVQLFNKTNQMNLSTRRLTASEVLQWLKGKGRKMWVFTVADRFGESGLTGIVSVEQCERRAEIIDFLMSCRVMGRGVEKFMLSEAVGFARREGCETIVAEFLPTEKNSPCRSFWEDHSGFTAAGDGAHFHFDLRNEYMRPSYIERVVES